MTDPAPSPPAGQPPAPHRPLPRLGRGVHWSDVVAEIDRDHRARTADTEPAASPEVAKEEVPQVTPLPTPSLGEAGSSLGVPPADLRDALYAEIRSVLGDRPACDHGTADGTYCWPCAQRDRGIELRAYAAPVDAPPAAELLAMADDLNSHGGLDEQFVAGLLQAAAGGSEGGDAPGGNSGRGPWRRLRNALTQRLR